MSKETSLIAALMKAAILTHDYPSKQVNHQADISDESAFSPLFVFPWLTAELEMGLNYVCYTYKQYYRALND
jgi:hypothetical protein